METTTTTQGSPAGTSVLGDLPGTETPATPTLGTPATVQALADEFGIDPKRVRSIIRATGGVPAHGHGMSYGTLPAAVADDVRARIANTQAARQSTARAIPAPIDVAAIVAATVAATLAALNAPKVESDESTEST